MTTTTKRDLIRQVSECTGTARGLAQDATDALFHHMRELLIEGHRIEVRGFGVLLVKDAQAKPDARNPKTGEHVYVPARRRVHFKPGKQLKEALHKPSG